MKRTSILKPANGKHPIQKLSAFHPQHKNVNLGKPHGLAALDKSIRRDGYSAPMVAAADGEIFAGSKRLETSADVFGPDVRPIIVHSDGTRPIVHVRDDILTAEDPRAKRLGVADNVIAAMDWNPDGELLAALVADDAAIAEMARQEDASLKALMEYANGQAMADAEAQIDRAEELNKKWKVRTGDLFRVGEHKILCGDCTVHENVERVMGGEKANLCATDPPYLVNYTGERPLNPIGKKVDKDWSAHYREIDIKDADKFYRSVFQNIIAALAPHSAIYCWHAPIVQSQLHEIWKSIGLLFHQQVVWIKPSPVWGRLCWLMRHESCMMGWVKGSIPKFNEMPSNQNTTVWELDWEGKGRVVGNDHPTQKPLEIFARPMRKHTQHSAICFEPFSGSGSQLVAAENEGRLCRAIELEPVFVAVTLQRMADAFPGISIERVTA